MENNRRSDILYGTYLHAYGRFLSHSGMVPLYESLDLISQEEEAKGAERKHLRAAMTIGIEDGVYTQGQRGDNTGFKTQAVLVAAVDAKFA